MPICDIMVQFGTISNYDASKMLRHHRKEGMRIVRKTDAQKHRDTGTQKKGGTEAMIISVLNQKGGVGKTTIALHIASGLSQQGQRIMLVDADPQGSARDWAAARKSPAAFPVVGMDRPVLHRDLPPMAADYDHVIVDGPPRATDLTRSAILPAGLVIVPVLPSPLDVWACDDIVTLLKEASVYTDTQKAVFVVNRKIVGTAIGRDIAQALGGYGIPVMSTQIAQRVAFAEALATGQTVLETGPSSTAAQETMALVSELRESYL